MNIRTALTRTGTAALLGTAMLVGAPAAQAVPILSEVFDITSDHCSGGCAPAGTIFGTVSLIQDGTSVDFTVHLNSGFAYAKTGSADDQSFKFNGVGITASDITITSPTTPALVASAGSFNGDGTGPFGFAIGCPSCGGGLSPPTFSSDIVFTVADATIADLTVPNVPNGNVFVVDIGNLSTGATGPVDATIPRDIVFPPNLVPEPGSLALLGLALAGVGFSRRRRQ